MKSLKNYKSESFYNNASNAINNLDTKVNKGLKASRKTITKRFYDKSIHFENQKNVSLK